MWNCEPNNIGQGDTVDSKTKIENKKYDWKLSFNIIIEPHKSTNVSGVLFHVYEILLNCIGLNRLVLSIGFPYAKRTRLNSH